MSKPEITKELRDEFAALQQLQTDFWDALSSLENNLGGIDIDGCRDFADCTIEDLLEDAEGEDDQDR